LIVQDYEKARGANYFKAQPRRFDETFHFLVSFLSALKDKRGKIF
jgi:hypothetical protein